MSIGGVGGYSSWWQWQNQATASSSGSSSTTSNSSSTSSPGNSITNTGSVSASAISAFMQAFSTDLQSAMAQFSSNASQSATTTPATTSPDQTAASQPSASQPDGQVHHHHHHHGGGGGEGESTQQMANQWAGEIDQSLQGGTLSANQINQTASTYATDLAQALQSYGNTMPMTSGASIIA